MTRLKIAKLINDDFEKEGKTHLTTKEINHILKKFLDYIENSMLENRRVELRGFGIFNPVTRNAKVGRNPKKPEIEIIIPKRKSMRFVPSILVHRKLNKK